MIADKLSIISDQCSELGENPPATADDGSTEWNVCSPAYERAIQETIEQHNWSFETTIATLVRVGPSPDDMYTDAMAMPNACLQLIWVRKGEAPFGQGNDFPADYKIIGNQICLNLENDTLQATAQYVLDPQTVGTGPWPPLFTKIIRERVNAAICFGLREDDQAGFAWMKQAEATLQEARTRVDQQQPKRAMFNGRARYARIVRRPWISTPFPWGGTGTPS